jgi:outer membrane protein assembly factor BamB
MLRPDVKFGSISQPLPPPAIADGTLYIGSCGGNFYALNAHTGALKWKVTTDGERWFEAKDLHGLQPKNQTIADPFDIF